MLARAAAQLTGLPPKVERCDPGVKAVGDIGAGDEGAEGEAIGDCLGHGHDLGLHVVMLDGEELARAAEATLNLVTDEEDVLLVENLLDVPEVALVGHEDAALSEDRLCDEGSHVARALVLDRLGESLGRARGAFGIRA